jgi:hypothetical protein
MDAALVNALAKTLAREFYKVSANEMRTWDAIAPEERSMWRHLVRSIELARGPRIVSTQELAVSERQARTA